MKRVKSLWKLCWFQMPCFSSESWLKALGALFWGCHRGSRDLNVLVWHQFNAGCPSWWNLSGSGLRALLGMPQWHASWGIWTSENSAQSMLQMTITEDWRQEAVSRFYWLCCWIIAGWPPKASVVSYRSLLLLYCPWFIYCTNFSIQAGDICLCADLRVRVHFQY